MPIQPVDNNAQSKLPRINARSLVDDSAMSRIPRIPDPNQPIDMSSLQPAPDAAAAMPANASPNVISQSQADRNQRRAYDEQQIQKLTGPHLGQPGSAHPGWGGKILHGLAVAGNVAGNIFAPQEMALLRGTDLNNDIQLHNLKHDEDVLGNEERQEGLAQSQEKEQGAETGLKEAQTQALPGQMQTEADLKKAETGKAQAETEASRLNNQPLAPEQAERQNAFYAPILQGLGLKNPPFMAGMSPKQVDQVSKALQELSARDISMKEFDLRMKQAQQFHADTEEDRQLQRGIAGQNHQDQLSMREGDIGRRDLDKAEGTLRGAEQAASDMLDTIDLARQGNKVAAQYLPTEGVIQINTANGIKRINRDEINQYAGAGNLFDNIAGKIGKLTSGQGIPGDILNDMQKLASTVQSNAYRTYDQTYNSTVKRYGLGNEAELPAPRGYSGNQGGGEAPEGTVVKTDKGNMVKRGGKWVPQ